MKKVSSKKLNKVANFHKWLNEVGRCNEILHMEREEYEQITKDNRESSSAPHKQCLKLLDSKCKLLNENEGCIKCRRFFIDHHTVNCLNDFPNPAAYKPLTQHDVDHTKCLCSKHMAAINTNTTLTSSSSFSLGESVVHPVAAILCVSHNPVTYISPNRSSILEATSDFDTSNALLVSDPLPLVTAISKSPLKEVSLLNVPHLYWKCLTSSRYFPVIFEALIDHGS